ncbi:helix-turn-helix transcriptional regulator [Amphiplicatus metriothermophilus]|uniref:Transcriptional regulator n=1 Tax=Amphiplicatus metriothermophilus TaxID=1519374 RepID=A0A239PIS8_9PROT|nr:MarR family transcriptional regulator [Amphiplicatus metriothermophilus]MBB5517956.1 putative ArsR family transcriptional regulator [Amphiplicatus metriothermophilus]SNT67711.1 transcriptional regulator [Amphiplicatus metriothermophilus]
MADKEHLVGLGRTQSALLRLLLRNKAGLTVDGIAEGLGVTRTAVNQHLAALVREGYVMRRAVAVATGGRPGRLYALTERGAHLFPKNYDLFSLKALEALIETLGPEGVNTALERLGRTLAKDLAARLEGLPLRERVSIIAEALQEMGFDAEETATAEPTPAITAYNCVYHALARAHPDVCRLDLAFLRAASGTEVDHAACMARGDNECRFRFRAAKPENSA